MSQCGCLDVPNQFKTFAFRGHFNFGEEPEVTQGEIWGPRTHRKVLRASAATLVTPVEPLTKEDFRTASGRGKNDGIRVLEVKGEVVRSVNGSVSFTLKTFLLKRSLYVVSHLVCVLLHHPSCTVLRG